MTDWGIAIGAHGAYCSHPCSRALRLLPWAPLSGKHGTRYTNLDALTKRQRITQHTLYIKMRRLECRDGCVPLRMDRCRVGRSNATGQQQHELRRVH